MKKLFLTLAAAALLASCASDEVSESYEASQSPEIVMSVNTASTRATTVYDEGVFEITLDKGDLIGVHLVKGRLMESPIYDPMNVKYKVIANGRLTSLGKPIKLPKESGYSLIAYYPYKDNYDPAYEKKFFTVNQDQSTKEAFNKSCFLNFSLEEVTSANQSISLDFTARVAMAKVILNEDQIGKVKKVSINCYLTGGMQMVGGRPNFITEGEKADVTMYKLQDDVYAAYVPAQKVTPGAPLYTIEYKDGTTETIVAATAMMMETAKATSLTFGKKN